MPPFEQGDVVRVPFPYTDRTTTQRRPALVLTLGGVGDGQALLWVLMITSAQNRPWPGDVAIEGTILPAPSIVRTSKVATIEARNAEVIGRLPGPVLARVLDVVGAMLGKRSGIGPLS